MGMVFFKATMLLFDAWQQIPIRFFLKIINQSICSFIRLRCRCFHPTIAMLRWRWIGATSICSVGVDSSLSQCTDVDVYHIQCTDVDVYHIQSSAVDVCYIQCTDVDVYHLQSSDVDVYHIQCSDVDVYHIPMHRSRWLLYPMHRRRCLFYLHCRLRCRRFYFINFYFFSKCAIRRFHRWNMIMIFWSECLQFRQIVKNLCDSRIKGGPEYIPMCQYNIKWSFSCLKNR